jgi:hypothetical protein
VSQYSGLGSITLLPPFPGGWWGGDSGALAAAIAVAFDDNLIGVVCEAIEGALGEDGIVKERDPLVDGAVRCDDGGAAAMALDDDFVEVAGLLGIEPPESEVIDDEEVGSEQATEHTLGGVIGPGLVDQLEEGIAPEEEDPTAGIVVRQQNSSVVRLKNTHLACLAASRLYVQY